MPSDSTMILNLSGRVQNLETEVARLESLIVEQNDQFLVLQAQVQGPNAAPDKPFDETFELYDIRDTTLKVRNDFYAVLLIGIRKTIGTGAGGERMDTNITISANTYIYLKVTMAASPTVTIETGATVPAGDDDDEFYPLWYIPWDSGESKIADGIKDLRYTKQLPGMAT